MAKTDAISKALAVPDSFRRTALAFPEATKRAVAMLDDPAEAGDLLAKADTLAQFARRVRADTETINAIQYGKLLIEARLGALLPRGKGGRGKKTPTPTVGVYNPNTTALYRKVSDNSPQIDEYQTKVADHNDALDEDRPDAAEISTAGFIRFIGSGSTLVTKHTGEMEWYTPEEYIKRVRKVLGTIDLDPASTKLAQKIVKAEQFYTEAKDGLKQAWFGNVFLNPPYKQPAASLFVNRLCDDYEGSAIDAAILLTNSNTDTDWWQRAAGLASAVCFTDGRISFYNAAGDWSSPTNGQTFCYLGKRPADFRHVFNKVGICMAIQ